MRGYWALPGVEPGGGTNRNNGGLVAGRVTALWTQSANSYSLSALLFYESAPSSIMEGF